jgi:hypothetical protein
VKQEKMLGRLFPKWNDVATTTIASNSTTNTTALGKPTPTFTHLSLVLTVVI